MLTLLINESNPLDGLFANSTTGGVGAVPDITVADAGQAVSVQSFTRAGGIITDSFVAGDVLHIGIGDGVNAPVCYVALSSASPATGTMPINTAGMVALFAATVANQLSLTLAVVRTRGAYTNTIFSAPIVIRRSAINISTAVPTPSILGTGVAAALQVAINTALGFVRLDASARYPALDGSQITNLAGGSLTVGTTAITSGTTTRVLFDNAGVLGEYAISGTGSVAMTTSPSLTTPTIGDGTEAAPSLSFTSDTNTGLYRPSADTVGIVGGGNDVVRLSGIASATDYLEIKNGIGVGTPLHVLAEGASANIGVHLQPKGSGLFTISDGTDFNKGIRFRSSSSAASAITLLDAVSTAGRVVTLPDATGTLALVSGNLGTPSALVGTNISGTASGLTAGNATLAATVAVANEATDTTCFPLFATAATGSLAALSNAGLTFNSATGLLSATGLAATTGTFDSTVTTPYLNVTGGGYGTTQIEGTGTLTMWSNVTGQKWLKLDSTEDSVKLYNSAGGYSDPPTVTITSGNGSASFASGACTINGSGYAGAGSGLTGLNADNISSGTLAAARMENAGVHTGDATGTFPAITLNAAQTGITSVGTLTGGATGAGFTLALGTSTITGTLAADRGGTGVSNNAAATLTRSGNHALTITTTGTTGVTLPTTGTLASLAGTEAFTGKTYEGNTITTGTGTLTLSTFTLTAATTGTVFTSGTKADVLDAACFAEDAGANDTYTATLSPAITAYVTGAHYRFKANTANTGAATINLNALGAKTIVKAAGGITTALADNDIRAGQWVDLVYDGTNMQMQSTLGNAASGGGSGAVIAVKSVTKTDTQTTTSPIGTAWVDITDLSITYTPTSASNKILISLSLQGSTDSTTIMFVRVVRDGSLVGVANTAGSRTKMWTEGYESNIAVLRSICGQFLDAPADTSSHTWKVQFCTHATAGTACVNRTSTDTDNSAYGRAISTMTIMEVTP